MSITLWLKLSRRAAAPWRHIDTCRIISSPLPPRLGSSGRVQTSHRAWNHVPAKEMFTAGQDDSGMEQELLCSPTNGRPLSVMALSSHGISMDRLRVMEMFVRVVE